MILPMTFPSVQVYWDFLKIETCSTHILFFWSKTEYFLSHASFSFVTVEDKETSKRKKNFYRQRRKERLHITCHWHGLPQSATVRVRQVMRAISKTSIVRDLVYASNACVGEYAYSCKKFCKWCIENSFYPHNHTHCTQLHSYTYFQWFCIIEF